jgi:hypothetical protein
LPSIPPPVGRNSVGVQAASDVRSLRSEGEPKALNLSKAIIAQRKIEDVSGNLESRALTIWPI